jgi:hypothetical protein
LREEILVLLRHFNLYPTLTLTLSLRERGFYGVSSPFKGEVRRGMGLCVGVGLVVAVIKGESIHANFRRPYLPPWP